MNWQKMLEDARGLLDQSRTILAEGGDGLTVEQKSKVDELMATAEGLQAQADELRGDDKREERMQALVDALETKQGRSGGAPVTTSPTATGFKDWAEFLKALHGGRDARLQPVDSVMTENERKAALAEGAGSTGGYLVPPEFRAELLEVQAETAIVRPRAFTLPMASRSVTIPMLNQTTAPSAGETAFFGGVNLEWIEEAQAKPEKEPTFKQLELVAHELAGWMPASNALLADSAITLGALIPRLFAGAAGWAEDYAFLRGNGVGKPLGVINAPATVWITRSAATTFKFVDAVTMLSRFLSSSWGRGVWVLQQSVLPQLYQMQDAASQYIWLPNASEKGPGTLLGMPITFTEKLPVLGAKGDALLCDFGYYVVGDREMPAVASSIHERFRYNQTTWRISERVDGQPWLDDKITLADASTTVSPFVGLDVEAQA